MGLFTWIIVAIVVLAVIGLGIGTFSSGVFQGAQKVGSNPMVKNATQETKQFISNATKTAANEMTNKSSK